MRLNDRIKELPMPDGMTKTEIMDLLQREEYGYLPTLPSQISVEVIKRDEGYCAGKALLRDLWMVCRTDKGNCEFPVRFVCPSNRTDAIPCFIHINFREYGHDKYMPIEEIIDAGYAVFSFFFEDVTSDDTDFTNGLAGIVFPQGRSSDIHCGKIALWSWAASRVMDYALLCPEIDHHHITVIGHSRLGKTALLTGAMDERFYCAISNNSGCSGASLSRRRCGETLKIIWKNFHYWFCEAFGKYVDKEETLPFDQHYLIAANVPHRVYVASAMDDWWCDPMNEYLACVAANSYYQEQGLPGFIHPDRLPVPGDRFTEGYIAYHMRAGKHYLSREDWQLYIKYLNEQMLLDQNQGAVALTDD